MGQSKKTTPFLLFLDCHRINLRKRQKYNVGESLTEGVKAIDPGAMWQGIAEAALNYIVVSTG